MGLTVDPVDSPRVGSGPVRLITAPAAGRFVLPSDEELSPGRCVSDGLAVGRIEGPELSVPVVSAFTGTFMGMLATDGERVRVHQPIAWLWAAAHHTTR